MYSVLLVDDEPLVRGVIREKIKWKELGYELAGDVEDGRQAIAFIEKRPVDLVVTDINMPYVDGMELSRYLFSKYPDTATVILSGYSEFEYAQKAIQYRVIEYILKPVTAKELTEVLARVHTRLEAAEKEHRKMDELTEAYSSYTKNRTAIVARSLSGLVQGTQDPEDALADLEKAGLTFDANCYRIAVAFVSDGKGREGRTITAQDDALYSFAAANICTEILEGKKAGLAFQSQDREIVFLLQGGGPLSFRNDTERLCHTCQDTIRTVMHFHASVGIGAIVHSVRELGVSYRSAKETDAYRYTLGDSYFIDAEGDRDKLDKEVNLAEIEEDLKTQIKTCSHEGIAYAFEEIEKSLRENRVGEKRCRLYLQQVFRTIYDTRCLAATPGEDCESEREVQLKGIADSESLDGALTALRSYAYRCAELMRSLVSTNGELQAMLALDYLNAHYMEPDLSLNALCSYLGISASHFSSIFKEYTGMTFMEKLTGIRIEKAKELLSSTTLRNYEIAERVGYLDAHYFSIVFKKATGQSPSDFTHGKKE